jgi:hypothetical protein
VIGNIQVNNAKEKNIKLLKSLFKKYKEFDIFIKSISVGMNKVIININVGIDKGINIDEIIFKNIFIL